MHRYPLMFGLSLALSALIFSLFPRALWTGGLAVLCALAGTALAVALVFGRRQDDG